MSATPIADEPAHREQRQAAARRVSGCVVVGGQPEQRGDAGRVAAGVGACARRAPGPRRASGLVRVAADERGQGRRQQAVRDVDRARCRRPARGRRPPPRRSAGRPRPGSPRDRARRRRLRPTSDGRVVRVAPEDEGVGRTRRRRAGGRGGSMPAATASSVDDVARAGFLGVAGPGRSGAHPERDPVAADPAQPPGDDDVGDDEQRRSRG